jgi:hypothetical protein
MTDITWAQRAAALIAADEGGWVTVPDDAPLPRFLQTASEAFDAGDSAGGRAAGDWLRRALIERPTSARVHLHVGGGIRGFYALASAEVELTRRSRAEVAATVRRAPASLVAWIAKDTYHGTDGRELLLHAIATARRVAELQGTSVIAVDPFDAATASFWIERYGFRECAPPLEGAPPRPYPRLWIPLRAVR